MNENAKKLLKIFLVLIVLYVLELVYFNYKNIIITVDGKNITRSQFETAFDKNISASGFAMMGIDVKKNKKSTLYIIVKDKATDDLIKQALLEEEIEKKHIKVDKKEVNQELVNIIASSGSKENFNKYLEQNNTSLMQFKKDLAEKLKQEKLAQSISKMEVSKAEVKKCYQDNINSFKHDDAAKISHILIAFDAKKENKQQQAAKFEKAKQVLAEVKKNPADFAKIANKNSDDKFSAKNGGELGIVSKSQLPKELVNVVFNIKLNALSDIIKTNNGYHIVVVSERTKAYNDSVEQAKSQIISIIKVQKEKAVLDKLAESLKEHAKIKYVNKDYIPKNLKWG